MPCEHNTFELESKIKNSSLFKQLEIFIKIVECNSFSEAAKRLELTPSAASRSLSKLEDQVGATLIKRTTRSILLTESGSYLYERALQLFSHLDESMSYASEFQNHPKGRLKITCCFAFGNSHMMPLFCDYKNQNPEVTLHVDMTDQFVNMNEMDFDIALRITHSPPDNLAMRKICPIRWAYCATPAYLEEMGVPKSLKDLEQHDCLVYPGVSDAWKFRDENGVIKDLNIKNIIQANSSITLLQAALLDQGVVCLPTYVLGDYISLGKFIPLLQDAQINDREYFLYALYFPSKYRTPKVRSFIDFILGALAPHAPWDAWMMDEAIS